MKRAPNRFVPSLPTALCALATGLTALLWAGSASADIFDLSLQRLVLAPPGSGYADPGSAENIAAGTLAAYRQVVSEMAVVLAPKILTTADTLGYSGFQFTLDYSTTTISNNTCGRDQGRDRCPFQFGVEGGSDGNGNRTSPPGNAHTLSLMVRKGIWLPLPSFEIGAGATKLMQSNIFAVQAYAKLGIHEGYHRFPVPSIALRGSVSRVMGETQIDLTMAQIDATLSKSFGIAGTVTLVPYAGAAWLYIIPRGQVLDLTPQVDAYRQGPSSLDLNNNTVFPSSANEDITRWRFFGGLRLNYSVLVVTADFMATLCGDWNGGCGSDRHPTMKVPDNAATQFTYSLSVGFLM